VARPDRLKSSCSQSWGGGGGGGGARAAGAGAGADGPVAGPVSPRPRGGRARSPGGRRTIRPRWPPSRRGPPSRPRRPGSRTRSGTPSSSRRRRGGGPRRPPRGRRRRRGRRERRGRSWGGRRRRRGRRRRGRPGRACLRSTQVGPERALPPLSGGACLRLVGAGGLRTRERGGRLKGDSGERRRDGRGGGILRRRPASAVEAALARTGDHGGRREEIITFSPGMAPSPVRCRPPAARGRKSSRTGAPLARPSPRPRSGAAVLACRPATMSGVVRLQGDEGGVGAH